MSDLPGAGAVDAVVPVLAAEPSLQPPLLPSSHICEAGSGQVTQTGLALTL